MDKYVRIPLSVEAVFEKSGRVKPLKVYFNDEAFEISRIISLKKICPKGVACIAPIEFTVIIDSIYKKLYYERETNTWFSVKLKSEVPQ